MNQDSASFVKFELIPCSQSTSSKEGSHPENFIGVITLQNPKALNALNLSMVKDLARGLLEWAHDPSIRCLFLHAESPRAFCAGGDVKSVAQKFKENPQNAKEFFQWEYKTDYLFQIYPKPIVCWGEGIVMGGGIGLMNGCSHRIVTESSLLAMPEITIGLFPDVGAGYFLNKLPSEIAFFLGLTAARLTAADALHLKFADFYIPAEKKNEVLQQLIQSDWSGQSPSQVLQKLLTNFSQRRPPSRFQQYEAEIIRRLQGKSLPEIHREFQLWLKELKESSNFPQPNSSLDLSWMQTSLETYFKGSPTSAHILYEQLRRERQLSILEVFLMEYALAQRVASLPDFYEGVRALLIDKDNQPQWSPPLFEQVSPQVVRDCFQPLPTAEYLAMEEFFQQGL